MPNRKNYRAGQGNQLVAALPKKDREQLLKQCEVVSLELKAILYEMDEPIRYVYFPLDGVMSIVSILEDGTLQEVGTVGKEGMVGLPVFLGAERVPFRMFAQVAGDALRMEAAAFRKQLEKSDALRALLQLYVNAMFTQLGQSVVCNRLHSIEERSSRWLLMTRDRVGSNQFQLTQEFLAQMLGVRRASVSQVAAKFREEGLIEYERGVIRILKPKALEARGCECYRIVKDEYDRLIGEHYRADKGRKRN